MPIVDRSIDAQRVIEDELTKEQKKPIFDYTPKKIKPKLDKNGKPIVGDPQGEAFKRAYQEEIRRQQEEKENEYQSDKAREAQRQANATKERQAVADADLEAFQSGKSTKTRVRRGA